MLFSGQEHRQLQHQPSTQLCLVEPPNETPYLVYTEDMHVSKINQQGLAHSKKVIQRAYLKNPHSCIAGLYKLYVSYCPVDQPDYAFS